MIYTAESSLSNQVRGYGLPDTKKANSMERVINYSPILIVPNPLQLYSIQEEEEHLEDHAPVQASPRQHTHDKSRPMQSSTYALNQNP